MACAKPAWQQCQRCSAPPRGTSITQSQLQYYCPKRPKSGTCPALVPLPKLAKPGRTAAKKRAFAAVVIKENTAVKARFFALELAQVHF